MRAKQIEDVLSPHLDPDKQDQDYTAALEGVSSEEDEFESESESESKDNLAISRKEYLAEMAEARAKMQKSQSSWGPPSSSVADQAKAAQLLAEDFPDFLKYKVGEMSPEGIAFVSWDLIIRYPQLFIGNHNRPKVCFHFFDSSLA